MDNNKKDGDKPKGFWQKITGSRFVKGVSALFKGIITLQNPIKIYNFSTLTKEIKAIPPTWQNGKISRDAEVSESMQEFSTTSRSSYVDPSMTSLNFSQSESELEAPVPKTNNTKIATTGHTHSEAFIDDLNDLKADLKSSKTYLTQEELKEISNHLYADTPKEYEGKKENVRRLIDMLPKDIEERKLLKDEMAKHFDRHEVILEASYKKADKMRESSQSQSSVTSQGPRAVSSVSRSSRSASSTSNNGGRGSFSL